MSILPAFCLYTMCMPGTCKGQKRTLRSHNARITDGCESPFGVVGSEPGFSGRAISALSHQATFPAFDHYF